jgi:hypothetical protein
MLTDILAGIREEKSLAVDVDMATKHTVANLWVQVRNPLVNFDTICVNSNSNWDVYTRSLTPDLPTFLSDYLADLLRRTTDTRKFWSSLADAVSRQDRQSLAGWYSTSAAKLAGEPVRLPAWLK